MLLIYPPDDNNVYGSRGGSLRGYGPCRELKVVQSSSYWGTSYSLVERLLL